MSLCGLSCADLFDHGLFSDGLVLGTGVNRLPLDQRWNIEGWTDLGGMPWGVRARARREAALPLESGESLPVVGDPAAAADSEVGGEGKVFFVLKLDVADNRFGKTDGCAGCRAIVDNTPYPVEHSTACRQGFTRP